MSYEGHKKSPQVREATKYRARRSSLGAAPWPIRQRSRVFAWLMSASSASYCMFVARFTNFQPHDFHAPAAYLSAFGYVLVARRLQLVVMPLNPMKRILVTTTIAPGLAGACSSYEVETAHGSLDALQRLRKRAFDVMVTSGRTHIDEDLPCSRNPAGFGPA